MDHFQFTIDPSDFAWRLIAAETPPQWTGDLKDDCTAIWAGFTLRAEKMYKNYWWWCVYEDGCIDQIASSNDPGAERCVSGHAARLRAEHAARRLLGMHPGP